MYATKNISVHTLLTNELKSWTEWDETSKAAIVKILEVPLTDTWTEPITRLPKCIRGCLNLDEGSRKTSAEVYKELTALLDEVVSPVTEGQVSQVQPILKMIDVLENYNLTPPTVMEEDLHNLLPMKPTLCTSNWMHVDEVALNKYGLRSSCFSDRAWTSISAFRCNHVDSLDHWVEHATEHATEPTPYYTFYIINRVDTPQCKSIPIRFSELLKFNESIKSKYGISKQLKFPPKTWWTRGEATLERRNELKDWFNNLQKLIRAMAPEPLSMMVAQYFNMFEFDLSQLEPLE